MYFVLVNQLTYHFRTKLELFFKKKNFETLTEQNKHTSYLFFFNYL